MATVADSTSALVIPGAGIAVLSETGREGGSPKPVNQDTFLVDSTSSGLTVVGVFDGHGEQPWQ